MNQLNIERGALHNITTASITQHGGATLLRQYGSIWRLLASLYPEYKQAGRAVIATIMKELKLSRVEQVVHVSMTYPSFSQYYLPYISN